MTDQDGLSAKGPTNDNMQQDVHEDYVQARTSIEDPANQETEHLMNLPEVDDADFGDGVDSAHRCRERSLTPAVDYTVSAGADNATDAETQETRAADSSQVPESRPGTLGPLVTRSNDSIDKPAGFTFGQAPKHNRNFAIQCQADTMMHGSDRQTGPTEVPANQPVQHREGHCSPPTTVMQGLHQQAPVISSAIIHHHKKRKHRQSRRSDATASGVQRLNAAPTEPVADVATAETSALQTIDEGSVAGNDNDEYDVRTFVAAREIVQSTTRAPSRDREEFFDCKYGVQEGEEDGAPPIVGLRSGSDGYRSIGSVERIRPATPETMIGDHMQHNGGASLPGTQLHGDLLAATLQQRFVSRTHRPAEPNLPTVGLIHEPDLPTVDLSRTAGQEFDTRAANADEPYDDGQDQQHMSFRNRGSPVEPAYPTPRPRKRKSKGRKKATAPVPAVLPSSDPPSSDVNDYLNIMAHKWNEKRETAKAKFSRERDALLAEVQHLSADKEAVQEELSGIQRQVRALLASDGKQRTKIAAYEAKVDKLKTFIEGLGNDVDALKRDASAAWRKTDKLSRNAQDRTTHENALHQELSECANRSVELKNQAIKACHELQSDLQAAGLRSDYLEQQLNERIGMLAEERDRSSRLERQLSEANGSVDKVLRAIKQSSEATLDKLFELHAEIELRDKSKETTELIEKTISAVRRLNSHESDHADDVSSVKTSIEGLSKNVESLLEKTAGPCNQDKIMSANDIEKAITDALKDLRTELELREKQVQQKAAQREAAIVLQEKLNATKVQLEATSGQLAAVQGREKELQKQVVILRTRVGFLESKTGPDEIQMRDLRSELASQANVLDSVKTDLAEKVEKCRSLEGTNVKLQDQLETFQRQMESARSQAVDFQTERDQLNRQFAVKLQQMRECLARESTKTQVAEKSRMENHVRRIQNQLEDAQKQLQSLRMKDAQMNAKHAELIQKVAELDQTKHKGNEELAKQLRTTTNESEGLKATIKELQSQAQESAADQLQCTELAAQIAVHKGEAEEKAKEGAVLAKQLKETQEELHRTQIAKSEVESTLDRKSIEHSKRLEELTSQAATEKAKAVEKVKEVVVLARQLDDSQGALHRAQAAKLDVESTLDRQLSENATALRELEVQVAAEARKAEETTKEGAAIAQRLSEAQDALHHAQAAKSEVDSMLDQQAIENAAALLDLAAKVECAETSATQAEEGLEQFKVSSQHNAREERLKFERHLQALQDEMAGLRNQLAEEETKQKAYMVEVSKSWEQEVQDHERRLKDATSRIEDAQRQRNATLADNEELREQLEQISAAQSAAMPPPPRRGPISDRSRESQPLQNADNARMRVTPTLIEKENEPPRPTRKRVDRNVNAVIEDGPIPAPNALRPQLHSNHERGPIVEESQFEIKLPLSKRVTDKPRMPLVDISLDLGDAPVETTSSSSQRPPEIKETEFFDNLLPFVNLNDGPGSSSPPIVPKDMASAPHMHGNISPVVFRAPHTPSRDNRGPQRTPKQAPHAFNIFEDDTDLAIAAFETQLPEVAPRLDHGPKSIHKEAEKFTFQKAHPNPNTSVKRRPSDGADNQVARRNQPSHSWPIARGDVESPLGAAARGESAAHSSSPDFVPGHVSACRVYTCQAAGNGSVSMTRRTFRTQERPTADPRLANRGQASAPLTKRKAKSHVLDNYELERKRRMDARDSAATGQSAAYARRSSTQPDIRPSVYDVPSSSGLSSGSPNGSDLQSRGHNSTGGVRTVAGQIPRSLKGGKKMSRSDQMGARFTAELR